MLHLITPTPRLRHAVLRGVNGTAQHQGAPGGGGTSLHALTGTPGVPRASYGWLSGCCCNRKSQSANQIPRTIGGRHHGERPTLRQAKGAGAPAANRAASCAASACSCPAVQSGPAAHVSRRGRAVTREASRRPQARCATAFSPCPMRPQRGKTRRRCELAAARSWGCCACTND